MKTYSEGGYRVCTTQGADDDGSLEMPPTYEGRPITIDGETIDEIRDHLADEGFDDEAGMR